LSIFPVVICIISLQNYFCVKFLKINYLNLVPAPIVLSTGTYYFTKINYLNLVPAPIFEYWHLLFYKRALG